METRTCLRIVFAALVFGPILSRANDHQICYQKPPLPGFTTITGQFLCRTDGTTTPGCQVTGVTGAATFFHSPQGAGDTAEATFAAPGTFVGTIQFNDGTTRTCTLEIPTNPLLKPVFGQENPGVLSFTTDASGLVTTGIWTATSFASVDLKQTVLTPPDFVAVGGGFTGAVAPTAVLMNANLQDEISGPRNWVVSGEGTSPGTSSTVTGYVIGIKIEGVNVATLSQMISSIVPAPSYPVATRPSMSQTVNITYPQSTAAIGGGMKAIPTGQYLTTGMPLTWQQCYANSTCEEMVSGWKVSSTSIGSRKRPTARVSGQVFTQVTTLPKTLTIAGQQFHVETWVLSANSAQSGTQPSASVTLPLDYALTAVGATASVQGIFPTGGDLLWNITPMQGGAGASSVVMPTAARGILSVYAVGMKLVAGPIPRLAPINLNKIPGTGKVFTKPPPKTN